MRFKQLLCAASFISTAFIASQSALSDIQPDRSRIITETQFLNQFSTQTTVNKLLTDEGGATNTPQVIPDYRLDYLREANKHSPHI